jgi:hypothetical protein
MASDLKQRIHSGERTATLKAKEQHLRQSANENGMDLDKYCLKLK